MRAAFPMASFQVFERVDTFLAWLTEHRQAVDLITLDYHLGYREAGNGLQAAQALAQLTPLCPVVLHSNDYVGAAHQAEVLEEAGWTTARVSFTAVAWAAAANRLLRES